jgi:hypothetical protein
MATLRHLRTDADVALAARHVIGRSRSCQLQIDAGEVSATHAEIAWDGRAWHLRDLGSRNGTFVAGQRIPPGKQVALDLGTEIGFGAPDSQYRFVDDSAPRLIAFGPDQVRVAEDDMLCLPSPDEWEVMIFCDSDGRWVIETVEGTRPLKDEECVVVGGRPYVVHLPGGVLATRDVEALGEDALDRGVLELLVSRDGEHVDVCLRSDVRVYPIESRAHVFLLLALARARLADAGAAQLPESEHGWMYREELMKELAIEDPQLLNLWVFRARQQLAQLKLRGASKVVERREGTGQLRLGLRHVRVIDA